MEMKFAVTDAIVYTPKDGVRQARDAKKVSPMSPMNVVRDITF